MGFSVSAATGVVFLGLFVAAGILYPAVANGAEVVLDARAGAADRALDRTNTGVAVANATYYAANDTLVVRAVNDGTTALSLADVDLLADNEYLSVPAANVTVAGNATTELWLPGETARFEVGGVTPAPARVLLAVDHGVRDDASVEVI